MFPVSALCCQLSRKQRDIAAMQFGAERERKLFFRLLTQLPCYIILYGVLV